MKRLNFERILESIDKLRESRVKDRQHLKAIIVSLHPINKRYKS